MNILLIAPPAIRIRYNISGVYPMPPLGLAYIAAVLEKNGFNVHVLDMPAMRMTLEEFPAHLKGKDYSVFGISCNIFNLKNGIALAGMIKQYSPRSKVIVGGMCSIFPAEIIFKYASGIDMVVQGEGEGAMLEICRSLASGKDPIGIPRTSFRNGTEVVTNPISGYAQLDSLPFPARHLLPHSRYSMHPPFGIYPPVTIMETARGCSFKCTFCTFRQPVRMRSVDSILAEIGWLTDNYRTREIHFIDQNFTYDRDRVTRLCSRLTAENHGIKWTCKTRVDLVSQDLLDAMAGAGCYMISYGVEAGSQQILKNLQKEITVGDTEKAFLQTKNAGIRSLAYVLLGSPGEGEDTVKETVNLVRRIKPDFVLYGKLMPDPNSTLVRTLYDNKSLTQEEVFRFYVFGESILQEVISGISEGKVNHWLSSANRDFYLRPSYILRRLSTLKNMRDLLTLFKGSLFLLRDRFDRSTFWKTRQIPAKKSVS